MKIILLIFSLLLCHCWAQQQTPNSALENDIVALNYALTLENLEYNFYRTGLQNFTQQDFAAAGFNGTIYTYFTLIRNHEKVSYLFIGRGCSINRWIHYFPYRLIYPHLYPLL